MIFLGMIGNFKTDHVNVFVIQLPCQKLFFLYLRLAMIKYYKTFIKVSIFIKSYRWVGYIHTSNCPRAVEIRI